MTTEIGIFRAEAVAFLISPRNSAVALAHMFEKTRMQYLLVSEDLKYLATTAIGSMENPPQIALMPKFEDLYSITDSQFEFMPPLRSRNVNDTSLILHSSGKPQHI